MQLNLLCGQGEFKDRAAGPVVPHGDRTAVGRDDGLAQKQAQAQAAAAVRHLVCTAVEHVEHLRLDLVGNAGAIVGDAHHRPGPGLFGFDADVRARRGVLHGVVHDVDDHLYDQPRIHVREQEVLAAAHADLMLHAPAVDVAQRLGDDLIHQLHGGVQVHAALLDARDRQQVFHQIDQPHGIVVDVRVELLLGGLVEVICAGQQVACVSRDGGQRRAQVVGDGAQQVGPQLLVLGQDGRGLLLPGVLFVLQRQRTLAQHGQQHAVFKGAQRLPMDRDAHHAVHVLVHADGQIQAPRSGEAVRGGAGVLVVLQHPAGHRALILARQALAAVVALTRVQAGRTQLAALAEVGHHVPVQELDDLIRQRGGDLLPIPCAVEQLVGVEEDLRAIGRLRRLPGVVLQSHRQRRCDVRRQEHDDKGHRIARVVGVQRVARLGEQVVEDHHAGDG